MDAGVLLKKMRDAVGGEALEFNDVTFVRLRLIGESGEMLVWAPSLSLQSENGNTWPPEEVFLIPSPVLTCEAVDSNRKPLTGYAKMEWTEVQFVTHATPKVTAVGAA